MKTMYRISVFLLGFALAASASLVWGQHATTTDETIRHEKSAHQNMHDAGQNTKEAAKDVGEGTKKETKKAYHETKKGTKKAYNKTKNTTKGAMEGAKEGARQPE
jgi:hypothetical protein